MWTSTMPVQVPGGGQYARRPQRLDGVCSPSYSWRGGFGYEFLDGHAREVAWVVLGVSFVVSRPPRTWRRWFVFVLLLNPGSPCHLPELPNRVGHRAVIHGLRQFLLTFRPPCRRLPESVRVSVGTSEQSVPPAGSLAGVRRRAISHAEVLQVAGSIGGGR